MKFHRTIIIIAQVRSRVQLLLLFIFETDYYFIHTETFFVPVNKILVPNETAFHKGSC